MEFAALIAPMPVERFMAEYHGRRPVHIPAGPDAARRALLPWHRLNAMLQIQRHWSEESLRLIRHGKEIASDLYMENVPGIGGGARRASPAKVEVFLAMGASLVAQSAQQISPELRAVTDMLAARFGARSSANIYCSFEGVRALPTHYDTHDVFAVHCEGEKVWRLYSGRADNPLGETSPFPKSSEVPASPGDLLEEVQMRPGDLLYIPRGVFHDALASGRESLHLTFAVSPPAGPKFFRLLEEAALRDSAFRAYLPAAAEGDGEALRRHLDGLASRLGEIVRSPAFLTEVANAQRRLAKPLHSFDLPNRPQLQYYARISSDAALTRGITGAVLKRSSGEELPIDPFAAEAEWILDHPMFSVQELRAQFPYRTESEVRELLDRLERGGIVRNAKPG